MFGFNKEPLDNVTREEFNTYRLEMIGKLDLINKTLGRLVDMKQTDRRHEIEQQLEAKQLQAGEPERVEEEEEDEEQSQRPNRVLALAAGALGAFAVGPIGDLLRWLGILQDREEQDVAVEPEFAPIGQEMQEAHDDIDRFHPDFEDHEITEREIDREVNRSNRTILDRLRSLFGFGGHDRDEESSSNAERSTPPSPSPSPSPNAERVSRTAPTTHGVGSLSAQYESSSQGSNAIGHDSTGGTSYGRYQIASRGQNSTMDSFLNFARTRNPEVYNRLRAAGPADSGRNGRFAQEWRSLAESGQLGNLEHEFISATHYGPAHDALNRELKARVDGSESLQQVLWSTAVHHGSEAAARIFNRAYRSGMSIEELIHRIYDIRRTQFGRSTPQVRNSVMQRFDSEESRAIAMAQGENRVVAPPTNPGEHIRTPITTNSRNTMVDASQRTVVNQTRERQAPPDRIPLNPRNPNAELAALQASHGA